MTNARFKPIQNSLPFAILARRGARAGIRSGACRPGLQWIPLLAALIAGPALADGTGLWLGAAQPDTAVLLLENHHQITVAGPIVRARLRQTFDNPLDDWMRGAYRLPLPEGAVVDAFTVTIGQRTIVGEVQPRPAARAAFERASAAGQSAAIVEQESGNRFEFSLSNIPPRTPVTISLGYQYLRPDDLDEQSLRVPLALPRLYADKARSPAAVADTRLSILLEQAHDEASLYSPSHEIAVYPGRASATLVELAEPVSADGGDFVLRWQYPTFDWPQSDAQVEVWGGAYYVQLGLLPGDTAPLNQQPRDLTLVLDQSGSMHGEPMAQAKAAALWALGRLGPQDRINIIAFSDRAQRLFDGPQIIGVQQRAAAIEFIDSLQAEGGTQALEAIKVALRDDGIDTGRLRQVVFITDGAVANEADVFAQVREQLADRRLFAVGIGAAPNGHFLQGLARHGRGSFLHIDPTDDIGERMRGLFEKLEHAVLTDIQWQWTGTEPMTAAPARIADVYAGEPLRVTLRTTRLDGELLLSGRWGEQQWHDSVALMPGANETGIHKLWAQNRLQDPQWLEGLGENADSTKTALALEHQILTPYTALLAVDQSRSRPQGAPLRNAAIGSQEAQMRIGALPQTALGLPGRWWLGGLLLLLAAGVSRLKVRA